MNIREIDKLSAAKLSLPKKANTTHAFEQIYSQKLSAVSDSKPQVLFDAKRDLIDQSNRVMDLLDEYSHELRRPDKNLKDIDPLIKTIQNEINLVEAKAADPVYDGDDIGGVVNDLAVTANVAILKFQRGDFTH
jgi:hypothetical protein